MLIRRIESIGASVRPYTNHLNNHLTKFILGHPATESKLIMLIFHVNIISNFSFTGIQN